MNLNRLDLNLLIVFDAVMTDRSVARAAERIGLSPSAVSNALKRLRTTLGDKLFVRSSEGMAPTVKAVAIASDVRSALSLIESAIGHTEQFDPAAADRTFTIGMTDFGAATLMVPIVSTLREAATGLRLHLPAIDTHSYGEMLDDGRIDLAIGLIPEKETRHGREILFLDSWVLLADASNHGVAAAMDAAAYSNLEHIAFSPHGEKLTSVDRLLRRQGICRNSAITINHFGMVPELLLGTNYVATISSRLSKRYLRTGRFKAARLPFLTENFEVVHVWNKRNDQEPALLWLRNQIKRAAAFTE